MNLDQKCAEDTQEESDILDLKRIRKVETSLELSLMKGYKKWFCKYINERGSADEWGRGTGDG